MPDNRFQGFPAGTSRDTVCLEAERVLDSCRDRDCFENVRVFLTDFGNEIIEHTNAVRVTDSEIAFASIVIDPVRFNRGFYSVNIRFFIRLTCEACLGPRSAQEFGGIAVIEKNVVLYGGESNVSTFRSSGEMSNYCSLPEPCNGEKNIPTASVDIVEPIILGARIVEEKDPCPCCCRACDVPESVTSRLGGALNDEYFGKYLVISVGLFSVVRITRPGQYLVSAAEYAVPEKECISPETDDPCGVFNSMPFPADEFSSAGARPQRSAPARQCGCANNGNTN